MPPAGFFAAATSTFASGTGALTLLTPSSTRALDVMYAVIVAPNASTVTPPAGWTLLAALSGSVAYTAYVYRRQAVLAEPAQHVFQCAIATTPDPLGILVLYRGLDASAALVATARAEIAVAATAYGAPVVALANYSDVALLVYYDAHSPPVTFTPAAGTTQRALATGTVANQGALMLADYFQEATGATPIETATASVAGVGFAATIAVQAQPILVAPSVTPDIPGAIGFVTVGV